LIKPETVRNAFILTQVLAFLLGFFLIFKGGMVILFIVIASLVCGCLRHLLSHGRQHLLFKRCSFSAGGMSDHVHHLPVEIRQQGHILCKNWLLLVFLAILFYLALT
jgi:hypothetical protein